MADNKQGRDKQAHDTDNRQRARDLATELDRMDEPEPLIDETTLAFFETELESLDFPATGAQLVETVGDHELESVAGTYMVAELLPETDAERFDTPEAVRAQIQRPTVAAAMKRVVEATDRVQHMDLRGSQREAYEKTFLALRAIDADDDDEGIRAISDWIVEQINEKERLPSSRGVRRHAAKYCRTNGYEVRTDEWLGV